MSKFIHFLHINASLRKMRKEKNKGGVEQRVTRRGNRRREREEMRVERR